MNQNCRKLSRRPSGFSTAEVVMSTLIVGILLVVAMNASGAASRSQVANSDNARAMAIASGLMAEIIALPFEDPNGSPVFGREAGESATTRAAFDDVDDYNGWSSAPQTKTGTLLANTSDLIASVTVAFVDPDNLADGANGTSPYAKRITVRVSRAGKSVSTLQAVVTK